MALRYFGPRLFGLALLYWAFIATSPALALSKVQTTQFGGRQELVVLSGPAFAVPGLGERAAWGRNVLTGPVQLHRNSAEFSWKEPVTAGFIRASDGSGFHGISFAESGQGVGNGKGCWVGRRIRGANRLCGLHPETMMILPAAQLGSAGLIGSQINTLFKQRPIKSFIPEPSVWLLLLAGFGALGIGIRRRPKGRAANRPRF